MKYREQLPPNCPPADAKEITTPFVIYRLVKNNPPTEKDFKSYRELNPKGRRRGEECIARGLSVWAEREDAEAKLDELPSFTDSFVCTVQLEAGAGRILKTGSLSHHTWWPLADFDILAHCVVE